MGVVDQETAAELAQKEAEATREAILVPLREKHGEIAVYEVAPFGMVVAARPENPEQYRVFVDSLQNDKMSKASAMHSFAMACICYPSDPEVVKKIFRRWPAFATTIAGRGQQLCGSGIKELGKD